MKRFTSVLVKPTRARSEAQAAACAGSAQLFPVRLYGLPNDASFDWMSPLMKKCAWSWMMGPPRKAPYCSVW